MLRYDLGEFLASDNISALNRIVAKSGAPLEGNCLYRHHEDFSLHGDNKEQLRRNLFTLSHERSSVLEVGFNAGHSVALFLYANPDIEVLAFDLCEHAYAEPCAAYLGQQGYVSLVKGDSARTVPKYHQTRTFELIHIDGGHREIQTLLDIVNCRKFANEETILVVDDVYLDGSAAAIDYLRVQGVIAEVSSRNLGVVESAHHLFFRYAAP